MLVAGFRCGGITWVWRQEQGAWEKVTPPHPDSLAALSLGTYRLTPAWQTFSHTFGDAVPDEELAHVVNAFGVVMTCAANGLTRSSLTQTSKPLRIDVRGIRYETLREVEPDARH